MATTRNTLYGAEGGGPICMHVHLDDHICMHVHLDGRICVHVHLDERICVKCDYVLIVRTYRK